MAIVEDVVEGIVLSNPACKTFAVGQKVSYELILVNTENEITIYNLVPSEHDALSVALSDSVAIVPAGSSKIVRVDVTASREGTFGFTVNVDSENYNEVAQYSASVEGKSISNNVVALTIVLAIIFVVLVIILIVLLTRKSEATEEFGESYY